MNERFAQYATSTAFALALSRRSCYALLMLSDPERTNMERLYVLGVDSLLPLERRGLVFWNRDAAGEPSGFGGMTAAGKLVAALLREAGMTLASTDTPMIAARRKAFHEDSRLSKKEPAP